MEKEESVLLRWVVGFTVTTGSSSNRANKLQTQNLHLNHPPMARQQVLFKLLSSFF